jgi:protein-disulfide isomerase
VNGQTISTADFPAEFRGQLDTLEDRIADARRSVLELQINTALLQAEAKKRGINSHQLYELEVTRKVPKPTQAQINKFYEDNRSQLEGMDPVSSSSQLAALIQQEMESRLADELVKRLHKTYPVVPGADINTPNLSEAAVVVTIAGQPIRMSAMSERLKPVIYGLRSAAYDATRQKAEQMIDDQLLMVEANRRQVGPEQIIRTEVSDKVKTPSEAEVAKFYSENKARIGGDLNSVRNQLVNYLREQDRQRLEKALSETLRKGADIRWLITEPQPPVQLISVDDDPSRGDANASVTIVEFTDFQCPACAAMHPVLEDVLASYGNKVRFVVRDFPLTQHEYARKAAEAANAAKAQNKFFEYAALLFKRQSALDVASLKKYATELGLNRAKFDAELDRGVYEEEVRHDLEDGEVYGISSTPAIFINGIRLKVLSADSLREAIDRAAAQKPQ